MTNLPTLGVGVTYFSGIKPILQENLNLVNVLEIEPQSIWTHTKSKDNPFRIDRKSIKEIESFPCPKLLHGIGFPVGGSRVPDPSQYPPFLKMLSVLKPAWVSEHLSFNQAAGPDGSFKTGFMLPPIQTDDGVKAAMNSIKSMSNRILAPLAVETGVNYLKPRSYELLDGYFTAKVVEAANCGILLDIHNLWTNEINGRQPVLEFLQQIPLDRVWEIHLAGGSEFDGYWVDSHSGEIPTPVVKLACQIIPNLPNLKAIIFELFPSYALTSGLEVLRSQLKILHNLWNLTNETNKTKKKLVRMENERIEYHASSSKPEEDRIPTPSEWEDVLAGLSVGRKLDGYLARELSSDRGLDIIKRLLGTFRSSMIVSTMKLTSRLLMLTIGKTSFSELLERYWMKRPPELFASDEAEGFANFLSTLNLEVPFLDEILGYEMAVLATLVDEKTRIAVFQHDPLVVLKALSEGRFPATSKLGYFEIAITPNSDQGIFQV